MVKEEEEEEEEEEVEEEEEDDEEETGLDGSTRNRRPANWMPFLRLHASLASLESLNNTKANTGGRCKCFISILSIRPNL